MSAAEAERAGPGRAGRPGRDDARRGPRVAEIIAAMPPLAVRAAKAAVPPARELPLAPVSPPNVQAFFDLFDTDDQSEGMAAFTDKRAPVWAGR